MTRSRFMGWALVLVLAPGCRASERGPEPGIPGAVSILSEPAFLGGVALLGEADGFALAWSELRPDESEERINFARVDRQGAFVVEPTTVATRDDQSWTKIRLVETSMGYCLWQVRVDEKLEAVALAADGQVLSTAESHVVYGETERFSVAMAGSVQIGGDHVSTGVRLYRYDEIGQQRVDLLITDDLGIYPQVVSRAQGAAAFWWRGAELVEAVFDTAGAQVGTEAVVFTAESADARPLVATDIGSGVLLSWTIQEGTGQGARFFYLDDAAGSWTGEQSLFGPSRVQTLDVDHALRGDSVVVVQGSDREDVLPRARAASFELQAPSAVVFEPMSPPGLGVRHLEVATSGDVAMALLSVFDDGGEELWLTPVP